MNDSADTAQNRCFRTFVVYVENVPGVLNRVASLFRRRNYNIDSLNVGRSHEPGVSRMTIVVDADKDKARRFEANLYKLVNVLRVDDITDTPSVTRDLALIKVRCDADNRSKVLDVCEVFRARVIDMAVDSVVIEITGPQDKIHNLTDVLAPFGIVEMVQSGAIAMKRGAPLVTADGDEGIPVRPRFRVA